MRRTFKDPRVQQAYDTCMSTRPTQKEHATGQAFFFGYDNPTAKPTSPRGGLAGSPARAAWAAGVDCRRADKLKSAT